jgi:hypothetical protein
MPTAEEKKRGVKKYRTLSLPDGKFLHLAIVKKPGPRGGHTVAGPVHEKLDWDTPKHKADSYLKKRGY